MTLDLQPLLDALIEEGSALRLAIDAHYRDAAFATAKLERTDRLITAIKEIQVEDPWVAAAELAAITGATDVDDHPKTEIESKTVVDDPANGQDLGRPSSGPITMPAQIVAPVIHDRPASERRAALNRPEPLSLPKVAAYSPSLRDKTTTRRHRVLQALLASPVPMLAKDVAAAIGEPDSHNMPGVFRDLIDDGLVTKDDLTLLYTATPKAPHLVGAAKHEIVRVPGELEPVAAPDADRKAACPVCTSLQWGVPIGWNLAGGKRRLQFQCAKCRRRFYADIPPEPGLVEALGGSHGKNRP